jgi:cytochrome c1
MYAIETYDLTDMLPEVAPEGCTATLTLHEEMDGPEGHFASGDDEQDADDVAYIRSALNWTPWAWCMVCITVTDGDATGTSWLGGVSYYTVNTRASGGKMYCDDSALSDFMADSGQDVLADAVMAYHAERARLVAKYTTN